MRLAASNLPADAVTALYTVPPGLRAVFTVSLCNRSTSLVKVRLALTDGGAPQDADWLEYDQALAASGVLERTGLALAEGQTVYCAAGGPDVSAVAFGVAEVI